MTFASQTFASSTQLDQVVDNAQLTVTTCTLVQTNFEIIKVNWNIFITSAMKDVQINQASPESQGCHVFRFRRKHFLYLHHISTLINCGLVACTCRRIQPVKHLLCYFLSSFKAGLRSLSCRLEWKVFLNLSLLNLRFLRNQTTLQLHIQGRWTCREMLIYFLRAFSLVPGLAVFVVVKSKYVQLNLKHEISYLRGFFSGAFYPRPLKSVTDSHFDQV